MMTGAKLHLGTYAWFEMVGTLMGEAASRHGLPPDLHLSLVERYTDGIALSEGLMQGLRFEVAGGAPSFRVGVRAGERGDIMIEISTAAARELNSLRSTDPRYRAAIARHRRSGAMRLTGDPLRMGGWLEAVHDVIVDRTA